MVAGKATQPQQGVDNRYPGGFGQVLQFIPGVGSQDAVAGNQHRPRRLVNQTRRPGYLLPGFRGQLRRLRRQCRGILKLRFLQLHIPGNVNQHRPRAALLGNAKGFLNGRRQIGRRHHQVGALGADRRNGADVALLKGFRPQGRARHLPGNGDQRHRVGFRPHQSSDQVRRPRPGSSHADPHLAGDPGVAIGGVGRRLLVPHQDMPQLRIPPQGIVKGQYRPPGMPE